MAQQLSNLELYHSCLGRCVDNDQASWILPTRILSEGSPSHSSTTPSAMEEYSGEDEGENSTVIPQGGNTDGFMVRQVYLSCMLQDFITSFTPFQLRTVPRPLRITAQTRSSTPNWMTNTLQALDVAPFRVVVDFKMRWRPRPTPPMEAHSEFFAKHGHVGFEWSWGAGEPVFIVPGQGKSDLDGHFGRIRPLLARLLKANAAEADEP